MYHAAGRYGAWELFLIPARTDNYIYALRKDAGELVLIDPGEKIPVDHFLRSKPSRLCATLLTHHHADHIGAAEAVRDSYGGELVGAVMDRHRLPPLDREVTDGEHFDLLGEPVEVMHIPGHTLGHVAYHLPEAGLLFCGDTLFSLGCGRLFEGSPAQMLASLERLASLPDDTAVCCGHEYTLANARFALTVEPQNSALKRRQEEAWQLREQGLPTLPSTLGSEKLCNPFLHSGGDVTSFAELRTRKDMFS